MPVAALACYNGRVKWRPVWLLLAIPLVTLAFFVVTSQPIGLSISAAAVAAFLTAFGIRAAS